MEEATRAKEGTTRGRSMSGVFKEQIEVTVAKCGERAGRDGAMKENVGAHQVSP